MEENRFEVLDEAHNLWEIHLEGGFFQSLENEVYAGCELKEMAWIAICCVQWVLFFLCFKVIFWKISQQFQILDDISVCILHLWDDFTAKRSNFALVFNTEWKLFKLCSQLIHSLERVRKLFIDLLGITAYNLDTTLHFNQLSNTVCA